MRFLTEEDYPPPRPRTSSWSSGSQVSSNSRPGPLPLEVWAPSLTLGRDGPGIILKEGKAPVLRKGLETAVSDLNSNLQKPVSSQPSLSAVSAQFSPIRYVGSVCLSLKIKGTNWLLDNFDIKIVTDLTDWKTSGTLCFFQTQSDHNTFSPDRLRTQSASRGARPRPQTSSWWADSGYSGDQWADRVIPQQCASSPREAQLTV